MLCGITAERKVEYIILQQNQQKKKLLRLEILISHTFSLAYHSATSILLLEGSPLPPCLYSCWSSFQVSKYFSELKCLFRLDYFLLSFANTNYSNKKIELGNIRFYGMLKLVCYVFRIYVVVYSCIHSKQMQKYPEKIFPSCATFEVNCSHNKCGRGDTGASGTSAAGLSKAGRTQGKRNSVWDFLQTNYYCAEEWKLDE